MEQYYYNHMNKAQQAAYHSILSGVKNLADEFQIPALEGAGKNRLKMSE